MIRVACKPPLCDGHIHQEEGLMPVQQRGEDVLVDEGRGPFHRLRKGMWHTQTHFRYGMGAEQAQPAWSNASMSRSIHVQKKAAQMVHDNEQG